MGVLTRSVPKKTKLVYPDNASYRRYSNNNVSLSLGEEFSVNLASEFGFVVDAKSAFIDVKVKDDDGSYVCGVSCARVSCIGSTVKIQSVFPGTTTYVISIMVAVE